jgi:hypothetical protein
VKDGRIKRDHPVEDRHNAAADLRELLATEPEDEEDPGILAEEAA